MYQLPTMPYLYQDLQKTFIDTHTTGLHYHKHEQNYLNNLNSLFLKNNYDFRYNIDELIYHLNEFSQSTRADILYNLGVVLNHNLYWKSMNPNHKMPHGKLKKAIEDKDGQFDIINVYNQDTPLSLGYMPLFNIDMWEHDYYLNYKNEKEQYLDDFVKIADFFKCKSYL